MKKIFLLLLYLTLGLFAFSACFVTHKSFAKSLSANSNEVLTSELVNKSPAVTARLIANTKAIIPGKPFKLGVELTMKPGWHTYYKEPGDAGMPTKIIWQLPPGFTSSDLYWQKPTKFDEAGITTYGYTNKTLIAATITPPATIKAGKTLSFSALVKYLSCKDICVPGQATVHFSLPVISQADANQSELSDNNKEFANLQENQPSNAVDVLNLSGQNKSTNKTQLITYFIFAVVGGFLLNFMPCVLPVVAIKILSLLEQPDKKSTRRTVIAFSCGILSSFLLLGVMVVSIQAAGHKIGWGFQFQQPIFLMFMSTLVLLFALSLLGLFNFSIDCDQKTVDSLAGKEGFIGDFFKGVLATILSTPCTAPFLGTALGFAFVEPWSVTLAIFAAIGIGMCLPYLVLIIAPQYLRFLPKPGDWMTKLKEGFGFVLLATVAWLLSILYYQIPAALVIDFIYFLLAVAFAIWLISRFTDLCSSSKRLLIVRSLALLIVIAAAYAFVLKNKDILLAATNSNTITLNASSVTRSDEAKSFDIATLNDALSNGKTVFLDFSAKWCLTCQLNESTVLNTKAVQNKFHSLNVLFIQADWTRQDPTVTQLLRKYERSGVPFYIIFPGKSPNNPIILPELLTQDIVLKKLDEAGPSMKTN